MEKDIKEKLSEKSKKKLERIENKILGYKKLDTRLNYLDTVIIEDLFSNESEELQEEILEHLQELTLY